MLAPLLKDPGRQAGATRMGVTVSEALGQAGYVALAARVSALGKRLG